MLDIGGGGSNSKEQSTFYPKKSLGFLVSFLD